MADLAALAAGDFEPCRAQPFRLTTPGSEGAAPDASGAGAELELTLVEVKRLGTALRQGGAFSLLFLSRAGPFLPQATYRVTHPKLGTLELFLVPVGPIHGGNGYEAVFT